MRTFIRRLVSFLTSPKLVFFVLPWLMVLLVLGTISQRYIGLYESERLFFSAWFVWIGPVPVPGTYPTLGLLALGLTAKLLFKTRWVKNQAGVILTHSGALLLLLGGLVTAITAEEGYITLGIDEEIATVSDYHQRELAIFKNDKLLKAIPHQQLRDDLVVQPDGMPFTLTIETYCRHCVPQARKYIGENYRGITDKIQLVKAPLQKEDEENLTGVEFKISGVDEAQDGLYLVYEPTPHQPVMTVGDDRYRIAMRKNQRPLPFAVRLEKFEKFTHPGTEMASEYQSDVTIIEEGGLEWQQSIRMNEPLRTHGYTLYQSSFIDARGEMLSVLAVVKNHGFFFPYIASFIMAIGLILQMRIRAKKVAG